MQQRKIHFHLALIGILVFSVFSTSVAAQSVEKQTTGTPEFAVEKQVIVSGGGRTTSSLFTIDSSIVQAAAGTQASDDGDVVDAGFWTPEVAPTAATASIAGQVLRADQSAISGARLVLSDMSGMEVNAVSSPLGYFRFDNVEVGKTYILTTSAKNFIFAPSSILINLTDGITGLRIFATQ